MDENRFLLFLKGLLMGAADVVPGVSGGTIALITGIYPTLVKSLSTIDLSFIKMFLKGKIADSWNVFRKINFKFFIPLGLGIVIAILSFSRLIKFFLDNYTAYTFAFFFGLIIASAVILFNQNGRMKFENLVFSVLGFILSYVITGAEVVQINHSLPAVFVAGLIAICAMILPGISGAFILLILNQYEYLINALHDFRISVILSFGIGAVAGLLSFSKVLDYVIKKFRKLTISFLIGVMLGSLRVPLDRISDNSGSVWMIILWGLIGFIIVIGVEKVLKKG